MEAAKVENLVLGGGEAGKYIAWEFAREGRTTVVVERAMISPRGGLRSANRTRDR